MGDSGFSFTFVAYTNQFTPCDNETRKKIRKQAMSKAGAARKKRLGYGQHNLRQYPVYFDEKPSTEPLTSDTDIIAKQGSIRHIIPCNPSSIGFESLRIKYNFDLLDLSALTTFHVGHATAGALATNPFLLTDILSCRQWSYLTYVPSRIGNCASLDRAAECVVARVQHWLLFPFDPVPEDIIKLYSKALKALQVELDGEEFLRPEVLCATELLSIYEVITLS
jgi:hypothetical protein